MVVLRYAGSPIEVRLGDRITYRRFLSFKRRPGVVWYMPGQSPRNPDMEMDGLAFWAVLLDDPRASMMAWPYLPAELQPTSRLKFVSRGDAGFTGMRPEDTGLSEGREVEDDAP